MLFGFATWLESPREFDSHSMLSLLTAPAAGLWMSAGGVQPAGGPVGPSLTPASEAASLVALSVAAAQSAAAWAAAARLATLAVEDAAAVAHACCLRSFARSTLACVVTAIVPGSS